MKPGQRVIVALRTMIASGELADGARIAEIATAERLGVSRMPVRTALRMLEQEGLVVRLGARGYAARGPSAVQIEGAVEVRGALEGLAVRAIAAGQVDAPFERRLAAVLVTGDALFAGGDFADGALERFYDYNLAFHDLLVAASGNPAIAIALARNNHLPFASAAALALDWDDPAGAYRQLHAAHREHHAVAVAILQRDPDRAERLMREHARASVGNPRAFERLGIERQAATE